MSGTFCADLAGALVIYCDENRLTITEGVALAEHLSGDLQEAAESRRETLRQVAPELLDDEGSDDA